MTSFITLTALALCLACQTRVPADDSAPSAIISQTKHIRQSGLQIELRESSDSATFAVIGIQSLESMRKLPVEDLYQYLSIRVQRPGHESNPTPMLGTYSITDKELCFSSRFPLSPSVQYRVDLSPKLTNGQVDDKPLLFSTAPKKPLAASTVAAVYPTSDVLPENLLKFYIHFSAPMSRGEAYQRVHLIQGDTEVESPFLELGEELWDAEQKRFTLFIHPGRIKRGLKPREDIGIPLTEGNVYRLQIDSNWLGADLQPLASSFVKTFRVTSADAQQPNPQNWNVTEPKSNTKEPLTIAFDEPLDHALMTRHVRVLDAKKNSVPGHSSTTRNETFWTFQPNERWQAGHYMIRLETTIEDLAGNNLMRKFETQEQTSSDSEKPTTEIFLDFEIR